MRSDFSEILHIGTFPHILLVDLNMNQHSVVLKFGK